MPHRNRSLLSLLSSFRALAGLGLAFSLGLAAGPTACGDASKPGVVAPDTTPPAIATRLPTLRVTTTNNAPITSKETYVPGAYVLADSLGVMQQQGPVEVRGHGNSTWAILPKKPYRLKFGTAAPMLAMPSNKHWVLLANYSDKTLLRNDIAFDFSRKLGAAWTPRSTDVDLYLNGAYQGIYQLAEHVRIAPERVNIDEMKIGDTSATNVTGGYLLEVDETRGEDFCFTSKSTSMIFCAKSPETLLQPGWEKQRAYIQSYIARFDSVLFAPGFADPATGYAAYIDVASAVDYYILEELFKNVDGNLRRGTYLTKPRGGKLRFGPVWDFDIAIGNANYLSGDLTDGWYIRTAPWFARLFEDPAFEALVRARWREIKADGRLTRPITYADQRSIFLSQVQQRNFERWPILDTWVWPNRVVMGTYRGEVRSMQDWLRQRIAWMDERLK